MIDTNNALQQLLQRAAVPAQYFPLTSRYHAVATAIYGTVADKQIIYLKRRFIPQPERFELLQEYTVTQGDRLDNITARYLGDPQAFWRICDANRVMRPEELETIGRRLRITLPEGIPGTPNA